MSKLEIRDLFVEVLDNKILSGITLTVLTGEVHAIMGPNGAGKSTLANSIMGKQSYKITKGDILLNDKSIINMEVDERARAGLFLAMQYPAEVPGVTNSDFMRAALKSMGKQKGVIEFALDYEEKIAELNMNPELAHRYLNDGFSGGEKKKNEILQMKVIKPSIAILDEIDSGLDVDALRDVGENVSKLANDCGILIITHYHRILDYIKPTHVHILVDGKIVKSGGSELVKKIDQEGYKWLV